MEKSIGVLEPKGDEKNESRRKEGDYTDNLDRVWPILGDRLPAKEGR